MGLLRLLGTCVHCSGACLSCKRLFAGISWDGCRGCNAPIRTWCNG
jgi:hypothetical protein